MNTELRKRLEEAEITIRTEIVNTTQLYCHTSALDKATRRGMEHGYKEAIKLAREWLAVKGVFSGKTCGDLKQYIIDFETTMNKLWEEKK